MATTIYIGDWYALELAFSFNGPKHRAYLDLRTGAVEKIPVTDEGRDEQAVREIAADPDRFIHIHPVPPRDQHRWMVKFAASIRDGMLRGRLDSALSGPRAFRQFKDALRQNSEEWRRWRTAHAAFIQERIMAWLAEKELAVDEPPPWQVNNGPARPERNDEHDRLRRIAHEHVGELSPAAVALAVVYLRHVHRRHSTG